MGPIRKKMVTFEIGTIQLDRVNETIKNLQDEIKEKKSEIRNKKANIELTSAKIEVMENMKRTDSWTKYGEEVKRKIETAQNKSKILNQYLEHLKGLDFAPAKLKNDIDNFNQEFYSCLKQVIDKSSSAKKQLDELNNRRNECDELRQKTQGVHQRQPE